MNCYLLRSFVLLSLALCPRITLADSGQPAETGETVDVDPVRGSWAVVELNIGGKKHKMQETVETLTFERGKLTHKIGVRNETCSYLTDPTKTYKELDMSAPKWDEPMVINTTRVIFRIDGDTLELAYSLTRLGGERPTSFSGPDVYVVTLKRTK
jgi:uncharacterized protein (TIGR03067 family)